MTEISQLNMGGGVIVNKCISNPNGVVKDIFLFDIKQIMKNESAYFPMPGGEFEFGQTIITTMYYLADLEARTTHNFYQLDCMWRDLEKDIYHWDGFHTVFTDKGFDTNNFVTWYCADDKSSEYWLRTKPKKFIFKISIVTPLYQGIENILL